MIIPNTELNISLIIQLPVLRAIFNRYHHWFNYSKLRVIECMVSLNQLLISNCTKSNQLSYFILSFVGLRLHVAANMKTHQSTKNSRWYPHTAPNWGRKTIVLGIPCFSCIPLLYTFSKIKLFAFIMALSDIELGTFRWAQLFSCIKNMFINSLIHYQFWSIIC